MTKNLLSCLLVLCTALLAACASTPPSPVTYDLGSLKETAAPAVGPISIAEARTPVWLDSAQMIYRLSYDNDQQPNSYAHSRWTVPPGQLFVERLKTRIAQAGGTVLPAADGALNTPVLRIEMSDFSQRFSAPRSSTVQVSLRASLFHGRALAAQKNFVRQAAAPTPDAIGGARALAEASDAIIGDMLNWLAAQPAPVR